MPDRFVLSQIRALPLFERLSQPQLDLIADAFQTVRYEPGVVVFQQGQPSPGLMLIVSGSGTLTRVNASGFEETVGRIAAGEYINESALFMEQVETANLRVIEPLIALFLTRVQFAQMLTRQPEIRANLRITPAMGGTPLLTAAPPAGSASAYQTTSGTPQTPRSAPERLFKGQRDDETVLNVFRRHPWTFMRFSWIAALILIAMIVIALTVAPNSGALALVLIGVGLLAGSGVMLYLYFEWRDDIAIVTDQRIVKIFNLLIRFENTISEIPLDRILEVTLEIPPGNVFARLFNYGTLTIRTAGQTGNMILTLMPNPARIQAEIFTHRDRYREIVAQRQHASVYEDIQRALNPNIAPVNAAQSLSPTLSASSPRRVESQGVFFARTRFINADGDMVYRKHSTIWLSLVWLPLTIAAGGLLLMGLGLTLTNSILRGGLGVGIGAAVFVLGGLWMYLADWDWRNDLFIVGDQTVTLIRKRPFWLQNVIDRIRLSQVDNVVSDVNGFVDNLFNRGEVRIYLIGADAQSGKVLGPIYDPQALQAELSRRQAALKAERENSDSAQNRQAIAEYLAAYHRATNQPTAYGAPPPGYSPSAQPPTPPQTTQQPPAQPSPYQIPQMQPPTSNPPTSAPPRDGNRPPNIPRRRDVDGG